MSGEARCPLGFTGTPPPGHPSVHGLKGGNGGSGSGSQSTFASTLAAYKPSTLLIVDAIFLGVCIIAAIYRDDLKALLQRSSSSSTSAAIGTKN